MLPASRRLRLHLHFAVGTLESVDSRFPPCVRRRRNVRTAAVSRVSTAVRAEGHRPHCGSSLPRSVPLHSATHPESSQLRHCTYDAEHRCNEDREQLSGSVFTTNGAGSQQVSAPRAATGPDDEFAPRHYCGSAVPKFG